MLNNIEISERDGFQVRVGQADDGSWVYEVSNDEEVIGWSEGLRDRASVDRSIRDDFDSFARRGY